MPSEPRVFAEGSLRWAQASGTATTAFSTASGTPTGLVGYVQAGLRGPSAREMVAVYDRGLFQHHKFQQNTVGEVVFQFIEAITANDPALGITTASGASTPMGHFELKSKSPEDSSALYYQFLYCTLISNNWTEGEEGNMREQTWRYGSMVGPTASGYMATALA